MWPIFAEQVLSKSRFELVHSQSQISSTYRIKVLLQSQVVPSGTEAPVVPSRMTLSVECPSMQSHRRQALLHSFPKAITPQVVLEELGLVSYRHPESQALIRTKVSIPIDVPDPLAKVSINQCYPIDY